jgi:hypothetical protein
LKPNISDVLKKLILGCENGSSQESNEGIQNQSCGIVVTIEAEMDLYKKSHDKTKEVVVVLENDEVDILETAL